MSLLLAFINVVPPVPPVPPPLFGGGGGGGHHYENRNDDKELMERIENTILMPCPPARVNFKKAT